MGGGLPKPPMSLRPPVPPPRKKSGSGPSSSDRSTSKKRLRRLLRRDIRRTLLHLRLDLLRRRAKPDPRGDGSGARRGAGTWGLLGTSDIPGSGPPAPGLLSTDEESRGPGWGRRGAGRRGTPFAAIRSSPWGRSRRGRDRAAPSDPLLPRLGGGGGGNGDRALGPRGPGKLIHPRGGRLS